MERSTALFILLGAVLGLIIAIPFIANHFQESEKPWFHEGNYVRLLGGYQTHEWSLFQGEVWTTTNLVVHIEVYKVQHPIYQFKVIINGKEYDKKLTLTNYKPWFDREITVDPQDPSFWIAVAFVPPEILNESYTKYEYVYDVVHMNKPAWKVEKDGLTVFYEKSTGALLSLSYESNKLKINVMRETANLTSS